MTSTIKVNNVQNQCGQNIINENSNTITIGASGDTIALASGASQTGFGRSGSVNWQTTKKTLAFTAANGEGYFVDTAASGAVTMTLPASPNAGDIVAVKDYNGNFATANLTIGRNGSPINGASSSDVIINTDGASIVLVYVDATQGWVATQDDASDISGESFITATGGTTADCGNFRIHTFTGPGTFAVSAISGTPANNNVDYLIIGGGGGGGNNAASGGGAGGYRETPGTSTGSYSASPIAGSVTALTATAPTSFPVTVGAGGAGKTDSANGVGNSGQGSDSTFNSQTSAGGGKGFNGNKIGEPGGSGSGGGGGNPPGTSNPFAGGTGNTPPTSPAQGNDGGRGFDGQVVDTQGGGGGGAGGVGGNAGPATGGNGGNGIATSITGSSVTRGGGGGGSADNGGSPGGTAGSAGPGGGGAATVRGGPATAGSGTANTGGGGGANAGPAASNSGGSGGSGVVIIRYKFQ